MIAGQERLPGHAGERAGLLDDLGQRAGHALGAVEDGELSMCSNGEAAAATISGSFSAICWAMTASWFWLMRRGPPLDPGRLRLHPGADGVRLGQSLGLDGVRLGLAVEPGGVGLRSRLHLEAAACASACTLVWAATASARSRTSWASASAWRMRTSRAGGGERGLAVRLGVGGLAHVDLELLLLLLRLQLGDAGLLGDDGLMRLGLGERSLLPGELRRVSTSAWKPAFLMLVSRIGLARSAPAAICSCPTASRSALARAMRALCSTSAWCGAARFSM